MLSDDVADRFKHWVTWRIVAELMRRHKATKDIRVYELHPAGGQGDTLAIQEQASGGSTPMRNNDFRGWRRMGDSPLEPFGALEADGGYVWPWLKAEDPKSVVDDIERLLGLPALGGRLPMSSPTVKTFMVMADILGLACLGRSSFHWRAAYYDSSGEWSGFRTAFCNLPHLVARLPTGPEYLAGQRFWMLLPVTSHFLSVDESAEPLAVVDLAGTAWYGRGMAEETSIECLVRERGSSLAASAELWLRAGLKR